MNEITALQNLLKYPHAAVFDKSPAQELALRVRHHEGVGWVIADEVLTLTVGDDVRQYDLAQYTFGSLAQRLEQDGFEVPTLAGHWGGRSALAAVEGRGHQYESNGDHIYAFTSLLWAMMSGYAAEVRLQRRAVVEALRQMVMTQAEGEWLELWGALYGVVRLPGESDADYAARIPKEAFRIRVNALAIENAIKEDTGKDVTIEEPWGSMFRLDESALSGSHRFYDGGHVGYHILRPVSRESIDWEDVLAVIERNRAAGVVVLPPEIRLSGYVDASIDGTLSFGATQTRSEFIPFFSDNRLDYLVLSGEEITRNWPVMISQLMTFANHDQLLNPESIAQRRTVARASIALSEGPRFGDENFIFSRYEITQDGSAMHASDNLVLSSPDQKPVRRPVDLITTEVHSIDALDTGGPVSVTPVSMTQLVTQRVFVDASIAGDVSFGTSAGYTWSTAGRWGDYPWSASQYEMQRIENIINRMHQYANFDLNEDLQQ